YVYVGHLDLLSFPTRRSSDLDAVSAQFPLSDVWGIGGKTSAKMREAGLVTVRDLRTADTAFITDRFGVHGLRLMAELNEHETARSEEHTSELQSREKLVCRLL